MQLKGVNLYSMYIIAILCLFNNAYSKSIYNISQKNNDAQIQQDSIYEDEASYFEEYFSIKGKNYKLSIDQRPSSDIVEAYYKYRDNIATIKLENDGREIFNRILKKEDFKPHIEGLEEKGILWGASYDHYNDLYISINFSIGEPDTDYYYSFICNVYFTGCYSIKKVETIEECE